MCRQAVMAVIFGLVFSSAAFADWSNSHLFSTNGFINPGVRVGFNPQPEPPGIWSSLDLSNPYAPIIRISDIGVSDGYAQIVFGVSTPYEFETPDAPENGTFQFTMLGDGEATVVFELVSESGGVPIPGTWEGFNPQPEPPGLGTASSSIGFQFQFDSASGFGATPAFLQFQILDQNGDALQFTSSSVPEPTTPVLFIIASTAAFLRRRSR